MDGLYGLCDMAVALCGGEKWEILHATPFFRNMFPCAPFAGLSLLDLFENSPLAEAEPLRRSPQGGVHVCTPEGGRFCLLRWNTLTWRTDWHAPLRIVDVLSLPEDMLQPSMGLEDPEVSVLLDSIHDGIWIIDSEGITLRINKSMERIADIRQEEVVGRPVAEAMKLKNFSACVTLHAKEEKRSITMFDDYANGRRCLNTSTPIFDEKGEVRRVIAIIRDITELEEMNSRLMELEHTNQVYKKHVLSLDDGEDLGIVGNSPEAQKLRHAVLKSARTDAPALLLGETGTGKSLAAKAIHDMSARKDGPLIALNCGGIPPSLVESELFGYNRGAFTGALKNGKLGVFELASGGTLFLDEIAELPLSAQASLLHVLDGEPFRRVGGTNAIKVDVRIIAATNKSLEKMVAAGEFREDLFYRLRVIVVDIPPLRRRWEDIPELAKFFLRMTGEQGLSKSFSPAVLTAFTNYNWPGNIRELRAVVRYMLAISEGSVFNMEDLPAYLLTVLPSSSKTSGAASRSLKEAVEELERDMITAALNDTGSTYKAARRLKVSQSTIVRKAQRYRIGLAAVRHEAV